MAEEEGGRPKRKKTGGRVIYRECDSDDEDYETFALIRRLVMSEKSHAAKLKLPALNPLQLELRQICRQGDRDALKTFLANNPEINLDFKDPEGGSTLLTEAATKTAQFTDIVALLLEAGADTETTDHMGNTPLHNTVLYFPSTMRTLDLLLAKGADVSVKNNEGSMPFHLSDDKDLKFVLKELKKSQKLAAKGDNEKTKVKSYSERPDLRKLVCDLSTGKSKERKIKVCFDRPVHPASPGLLKRKRKKEEEEEEVEEESLVRTKRIRFSNLDSSGCPIDPQFSDDDGDDDDKQSQVIVDNIIDSLISFVLKN